MAHVWRGLIEEYRDRLPVSATTPVVSHTWDGVAHGCGTDGSMVSPVIVVVGSAP